MTIIYTKKQTIIVAAELDWNTTDFGTGVLIASVIPNGARFIVANAVVQTQFDAGTSNLLKIGYTAGGGDLCLNVPIGVAANTVIDLPTAWIVNPLTSDRALYATYTQSGTAATAGKIHINLLAVL